MENVTNSNPYVFVQKKKIKDFEFCVKHESQSSQEPPRSHLGT